MEKIIRSVCQASHCNCGVLVHVEDGKVVKVVGDPDHPMNRGFICVKGQAQPELLYHPDRLKYPLKRVGEKGGGKWERVSWDEALDGIAEKLTEVKDKYAPEANGVIWGTGPRTGGSAVRMLAIALGTPNNISVDRHICHDPGVIAEKCTTGMHDITMEVGPDYPEAGCIVVWAGNPLASHPARGREIVQAKRERNAKLIVIDPRRITLASMADLWLPVRPGTDVSLALGMINVIIEEELYDKEFVEKWCYGFDELKEHVKDYPPEKVAEITWIAADKIREAARMYATTKPAVLHHRVGTEHNINSTQTDRALIILVAITGNIDVKGGNLLPLTPEGFGDITRQLKRTVEFDKKRLGSEEYPLISGHNNPSGPFVHSALAMDTMLTDKPYPLKTLYCAAGNPIVNVQNNKKAWEAMKKLELLVVADFFMTPTADLADYVLPAATWMEQDDVSDPGRLMYTNYVACTQKVIEPLYECWPDRKIVFELLKRMPWTDRTYVPSNNIDEHNESIIQRMGITFKDFQKKGYVTVPMKYKKYEESGFSTPSGKVELYSTILKKTGIHPCHFI